MALSKQIQRIRQRGHVRRQEQESSSSFTLWMFMALISTVCFVPKWICLKLGLSIDDFKILHSFLRRFRAPTVTPTSTAGTDNSRNKRKRKKKERKEDNSAGVSRGEQATDDVVAQTEGCIYRTEQTTSNADVTVTRTVVPKGPPARKSPGTTKSKKSKMPGMLIGLSVDRPAVEKMVEKAGPKKTNRRHRKSKTESTNPTATEHACVTGFNPGSTADKSTLTKDHQLKSSSKSPVIANVPAVTAKGYQSSTGGRRTRRAYTLGSFITPEVERKIFA